MNAPIRTRSCTLAGGMSVPAELGEVMALLVQEGDEVKEDMIVAEIETCKGGFSPQRC